MILTDKQVHDGEHIPWFYGATYYVVENRTTVCHVIPLNLLIRLGRIIYHSLQQCAWEREVMMAENIGFKRGWDEGYKVGHKMGGHDRGKQIGDALDEMVKQSKR